MRTGKLKVLSSIIVLVVSAILFPFANMHDQYVVVFVSVAMALSGSITLANAIADHYVPDKKTAAFITLKDKIPSPEEERHSGIKALNFILISGVLIVLQVSFYRFENRQVERNGINLSATVTNVYFRTNKKSIIRSIEYTYTVNGKQYVHESQYRNEAVNDTLPIRVLPDFPDIHYIRNYTLRKPPLHRGRAVSYRRICYPYAPPAVISDKITRAPWAISYHEYGPWDMFMNPVMVVIFPEGDQLKKVTLYHPDFGEDVPTEIAETTITGMQEKLAMTFACKLRSGNFPTEEMYMRKEERKDKLARRRIYHPSRFNFRIYNRGITRDLFYTNLARYFGVSNKEQVEAAIKLMRALRDE